MSLLEKYNTPIPRYTSYPTVPDWDGALDKSNWFQLLDRNESEKLSLYIHLPYCSSLCTYCACNTRITKNLAVQAPYINALLKEWGSYEPYWKNWTLSELHLGGGTPTFFQVDYLMQLLAPILDSVKKDEDFSFSFEGHPDSTSYTHLKYLRSLGFKRLSLGIQDFDYNVQKAINRFQSFEEVKRVVNQARSLLYKSINFDIIYGLPFQTKEGVRETINKVLELRPERIAYYSYAHVPWKKPGQRSYDKYDLPKGAEKRELYEIGKSMLLASGYKAIGMDHFSLENDALYQSFKSKTLHRNFMGYTPNATGKLIGLGASAISDIGDVYKQNKRSVEAYIDDIHREDYSFQIGHELTVEDKFYKSIIMNVMCGREVGFDTLNPNLKDIILGRMLPLIKDGLMVIEGNIGKITPEGEPFLRNIANVFDQRFWQKEKSTIRSFSDAI